MNRLLLLLICLIFLLQPVSLQCTNKLPLFDIQGPTILAFFPPVTEAEMSKNPDMNESLGDFQFYARAARLRLEKEHVDFREVYAHRFSIRRGTTVSTFTPSKGGVGYYFVAPGRKPLVEYGVMTDTHLLQSATKYFHNQK